MALKVKPIAVSTTKWAQNASGASTSFATEAAAAGAEWESRAKEGNANYDKAIHAAGVVARQLAGITKAGAKKFVDGINLKGKDRFSQGVSVSKSNYTAGSEPYYAAMAALSLSARGPRGDAANYNRSKEVGDANHAKRLALLGM